MAARCIVCKWYKASIYKGSPNWHQGKTEQLGDGMVLTTSISTTHGTCRRHAPITDRGVEFELHDLQWPQVDEMDWCGDYE